MKRILFTGLLLFVVWVAGAAPKIGEVSPALGIEKLLQAPDGAKATLADLKGKAIVIEFWATWCGPCIAAFPHINEMSDKFKDKPIQFIAVTEEDQATVEKFLLKKPLKTWIGLDTDQSLFKDYSVTGIPTTVLLDKEGKIAAITHPMMLQEKHLEDLLEGKPVQLAGVQPGPAGDGGLRAAPAVNALVRLEVSQSAAKEATIQVDGDQISIDGATLPEAIALLENWPKERVLTDLPYIQRFTVTLQSASGKIHKARSVAVPLLAANLGGAVHREAKVMDVLLLSASEARAPYLQASKSFKRPSSTLSKNQFVGNNLTMQSLADELSRGLGKVVVEEIKSAKQYDVQLEWKDAPNWKAITEQAGLKLAPGKKSLDVWILE